VSLGLVFLNPIYFLLVFIVDLQQRLRALALVSGAVLGPPLHALSPDWGLLLAGLVAGTAAFAIDHAMRSRRPRA
jgi:predicted branched-subunit amino acid permease